MIGRNTGRLFVRLVSVLLLILLAACSESAHQATDQPVSRRMPQIPDSNPERGKSLIRSYGCGSCHEIPGIRQADGNVGPPLKHWADRQYIAGTLPNTPENLIHWIRFPQAVEPGTVMPNLDIAEDEARDIAAYLYTLTNEGQLTDVFSTPRAVLGGLFSNAEDQEHGSVPNTGQQDQAGQQLIQQGEQVFANNCAQCHGQNGEGQVGPALAGSSFVTSQDPAQVIDTVLHGRGQMPAFQSQLSNEQLAGVVSYIRNSWGNSASTILPEDIDGQGGQQAEQPGNQQSTPQGQATAPQPSGPSQGQSATPGQSGQSDQQATPAPTSGSQAGESVQGPAAPRVALVEIYEWGLDIADSTLPAERVLFHVTNVGTRPHRFTIEGQGMELAFPQDLQVGQTRTLLANLRPGQYRIFSPLEDDAQRGISLEFTAEEEGAALPGSQQNQVTPTAAPPESETQPADQQPGQDQQATPTPGQQNQGSQPGQQSGGEQLVQQGEQVFSSNCAQCHGQNGEGQVGPALAGSSFVTSQDPAQVIDTVLHGRGQMPAFQGQLSNEQLAGVISYIRNTWGNSASPVNPDQIGSGPSQDQNEGSPPGGQSGDPGGQSEGQQQGEQPPPANATQRQVAISLTIQNRAFDNNTLTVPAGAQVTLTLTNLDRMPHNFALYQDSTAKQAIFIGQVFSGPERTIIMEFTAPAAPGTYYFRCDVHPYMNGALVIE